ncbi:hypothetical protein D7B24_003834 [Verticillium nonalfalfae]|uniref:DNA polymerase epsilon subunit D n=1 Tax=Verticillium nonalfalfae TaxID=1051616 RepID=A0A3M9XZP3_9PEZI|nr:uncharacterized protein D7B24_003834 [Verticillium nonalfalfae]RNJ52360.1 hypothetical protein D7B24_003834 [Verticillium nonalfalfae]
MPPKKPSPANPSVSAARFVPMDEDTPGAAPASTSAATSHQPPQPAEGRPDTSMTTANAGPSGGAGGPRPEEGSSKPEKASAKDKDRDAVTIEDLTLPRSIITRLAKGVLPPGTQIQANAILALNKSAAVFVNYLATHANEHTLNAGKKTIDPTHVFKALEDTELSFLKEPLEAEFAKYAQTKSEKRIDYRRRQREGFTGAGGPAASAAGTGPGDDSHMGDVSTMSAPGPDDTFTAATGDAATGGEARDQPRAKKARIAVGAGAAAAAAAAAAGGVGAAGGDDTEPEEAAEEEGEDGDETDEAEDDDEEAEDDEEEEEEEEGDSEADETVDALEGDEDRVDREEADEALDGNDSD